MPPDADAAVLQHYLTAAAPYLREYGYAAVFGIIFVEGFGIPAPGQTLLVAGALFAGQGKMAIALVLLTAWLAAVIGDNIGYAIGHFGGRRLVLGKGRYVGIRAHHLEKVEHFFGRFGGAIVIFARFFEVLRQLNGVVAGIGGMPWRRFLGYNALGAALWVGLWGGGAYLLGEHLAAIDAFFDRFTPYVIGAGLMALALVIYYLFRRRE